MFININTHTILYTNTLLLPLLLHRSFCSNQWSPQPHGQPQTQPWLHRQDDLDLIAHRGSAGHRALWYLQQSGTDRTEELSVSLGGELTTTRKLSVNPSKSVISYSNGSVSGIHSI